MRRAVVVMGVAGAGKSSVGAALAERLGLAFRDADALHAPEAVAKMERGTPLDDGDRRPWLDRVGAVLADRAAHPAGVVVACSALKRAYRDRLRAAAPGVAFVFLDGDEALLAARLAARRDHYMPASLLASQLATLERPGRDEADVLCVGIDGSLDEVIDRARTIDAMTDAMAAPAPTRLLHTMLRVFDLERSLDFYVGALGMQLLRRRDYESGRFTLAFVGYGSEESGAVLELTHNWDQAEPYAIGTAYGHIALAVADAKATCDALAARGVKVPRPPGPMKHGSTVIAFLEDPDGYKVELIQRA